MRFEPNNIVKRFIESRQTGFYVAATREGDVCAADKITMTDRDPNPFPVSLIIHLHAARKYSN
jgi:MOSC domain-containing protein YiiM